MKKILLVLVILMAGCTVNNEEVDDSEIIEKEPAEITEAIVVGSEELTFELGEEIIIDEPVELVGDLEIVTDLNEIIPGTYYMDVYDMDRVNKYIYEILIVDTVSPILKLWSDDSVTLYTGTMLRNIEYTVHDEDENVEVSLIKGTDEEGNSIFTLTATDSSGNSDTEVINVEYVDYVLYDIPDYLTHFDKDSNVIVVPSGENIYITDKGEFTSLINGNDQSQLFDYDRSKVVDDMLFGTELNFRASLVEDDFILMTGTFSSYDASGVEDRRPALFKFSLDGELLWSKLLSSRTSDVYSMSVTSESILCVKTDLFHNGSFLLMEKQTLHFLNLSGNIIEKVDVPEGYRMSRHYTVEDEHFVVYSALDLYTNPNTIIAKYSSEGKMMESHELHDLHWKMSNVKNDRLYSVLTDVDVDNIIVFGSDFYQYRDIYLTGSKRMSYYENIHVLEDGGIIVVGILNDHSIGYHRFNSKGEYVSTYSVQMNNYRMTQSVLMSDGELAIAMYDKRVQPLDMYVVTIPIT